MGSLSTSTPSQSKITSSTGSRPSVPRNSPAVPIESPFGSTTGRPTDHPTDRPGQPARPQPTPRQGVPSWCTGRHSLSHRADRRTGENSTDHSTAEDVPPWPSSPPSTSTSPPCRPRSARSPTRSCPSSRPPHPARGASGTATRSGAWAAPPGKDPVCYLKAYTAHVTFGFWRGQELTDPSGRLEPGAQRMAGLKLRTPSDIDPALFADWLSQARALHRPDEN
ncbi:DUF1801 domain-containing protein [Kitasatospora sp. MBT63]|uniref:DUF1801 domain-containing protein n=1 Tax=Kitasatospora sp. MBT63 TaxID=1444768 RepID=UPI002101C7DB|nr:DUF1801 domain-containing protein [Kitasatospora sp. MBT63]